jgi:hypothetical protein
MVGSCPAILNVELISLHGVDALLMIPKMDPRSVVPCVDVLPTFFLFLKFGCLNGGVLNWCVSHTWVYGFHIDTHMDMIVSFYYHSWTSHLPLICHAQDFPNLLHNPEILYLFFIAFQALPHGYGSLLVVQLILVRYSTARSSHSFHDLLDLVLLHNDWVQGLLLLSFIHFSLHFAFSYQCFPLSPMHIEKFSCLRPSSLHPCYIVIS